MNLWDILILFVVHGILNVLIKDVNIIVDILSVINILAVNKVKILLDVLKVHMKQRNIRRKKPNYIFIRNM